MSPSVPGRVCSVPQCGRPHRARSLCKAHYSEYHSRGIPMPPATNQRTPEGRFERFIDRTHPDGHWLWTGALSSGYGVMGNGYRMMYVHRWSYEHFVGPVPDGLIVGHECHDLDLTCMGGECIHRRCARPEHLKPMAHADNIRAGRSAQASRARRVERPECRHGHPLTAENLFVRDRDGARLCRVCMRASVARSYQKRKRAVTKG